MISFQHVTCHHPQPAGSQPSPALDDLPLHFGEGELILVSDSSVPDTPTILRAPNGLTPHFCGNMLKGQTEALLDARGNLMVRLAGYSDQSLLLHTDNQRGAPTRG